MSTATMVHAPAGMLFSRVPLGLLADMPRAARTCYEVLHNLDRQGRKIELTDRDLCGLLGWTVGRRAVQKGLRQLEQLGIIARCRSAGRRVISFLCRFATRSSIATNAQAKDQTRDPEKRQKEPSNPPRANLNLTGQQMAHKILGDLRTKGWVVTLVDNDRLKLEPIRTAPEPVGIDLGRLLRLYRDEIRSVIMATEPDRE
jgi:hypothetical protein